MSYIALYRKWRPLVFEDVVEQSYVIQTLKNTIISNRIGHAYLFCGSRGTGKTTMAKIFSRAINCLNPNDGDPCNLCDICKGILSGRNMDVIEIDAASNNGVDSIRDIRDEVVYTPAESKYKVYIIDEVHMLSTGAFNALLKTLEEPPSHVVFILATTEAHKIPATILSRCQRYDFRRISTAGIASRLMKISKACNASLTDKGASLIAKLAEGGMRDAISILDQCISLGKDLIDTDIIVSIVGISGHSFIIDVSEAIITNNPAMIFSKVEELFTMGKDSRNFISELILYFRDLLIIKLTKDSDSLSYPIYEDIEKLKKTAESLDENYLMAVIKDLSLMESNVRWARSPRIMLEIGLIKLCEGRFTDNFDILNHKISEIENKLKSGAFHFSSNQVAPFLNGDNRIIHHENFTKTKKDTVKTTSKSFSKINKQSPVPYWQDVINECKSMGRMIIYTNLLDSEAYFVSENLILIIPSNGFNKFSLSKSENIEVLQNILQKRTGLEISIRIEGQDSLFDPASNSSSDEDPDILKAKEIAQKANIPLNIIDE